MSWAQSIEKISLMAIYPFPIEPGDWFVTRHRSLDERRPPPACREYLWSHLEPRVPAEKEDRKRFWKKNKVTVIATLPQGYAIGPVYRVSFRLENGVYQLIVLVPSICSQGTGNPNLKAWVAVSHGTTQWARWMGNTGHPAYPRSAPGEQAASPKKPIIDVPGLKRNGPDGFEKWQKDLSGSQYGAMDEKMW